jgi:hypothetical protein
MLREYVVDEITQLREKLKKAETDNQELNNKYVAEVKKLKGNFS